jgi:hypothetical protein
MLLAGLGWISFLGILVLRVAFDEYKGFFFAVDNLILFNFANFSVVGNGPKILLFIFLAYWKLILAKYSPLHFCRGGRIVLFELLELGHEYFIKNCCYSRLLILKSKIFQRLLKGKSNLGLFY